MDTLDKLLRKYMDEAAKAVEPAYNDVRAGIHGRMKLRSAMRIGTLLSVSAVIVMIALWALVIPTGYPSIMPSNGFASGYQSDEPAIAAAPAPPELVLIPTANNTNISDPGHKVPVQMYVYENNEAVERMIADNVAIAQLAHDKGDLRQAVTVYLNLARTLLLHDKTDKAIWSADKAIELAKRSADAKLVNEAQHLRDSLD